jgi:RNA polymerase sigma factor (sigma-70 family)
MESVASRDPFQRFLDEHRAPVLAFLRAMVGPVDADDCFQETFMAALRNYESLDAANPRAWVMTIARNKAIDHHRARARARRAIPKADVPEVAAPAPAERDPELWAAVGELPDKQRTAVALRFAADLRYREVAAAMDTSEEAARRNVHEGLRKLRETVFREERAA